MSENIIQWYPGHMTKARRMMEENLKIVDIVIELLDARIPISSKNPDIDKMANGKARLVLLNKVDMANDIVTNKWIKYYEDKGILAIPIDGRNRKYANVIFDKIEKSCEKKRERDKKRGIINRPLRAMICGIPNVGKSTLINTLVKKSVAKTGNKPGVTKGKQWINLNKKIELLDTPGILWPKFDNELIGKNLAFIGSINDQILVIYNLAIDLMNRIFEIDNKIIPDYYGVKNIDNQDDLLYEICIQKKMLIKGGEPDLDRGAKLILDDFRAVRLGKISLETP